MSDPEDMELLAACEHDSWSKWTAYMLTEIESQIKTPELAVVFSSLPCVKRWRRQKETPYHRLMEREKESDRKVVREKLPLYRPGT